MVTDQAIGLWPGAQVIYQNDVSGPHEAGLLTLVGTQTRNRLGHHPHWPLAESLRRTITWYRRQANGCDARTLCEEDLAAYGCTHAEEGTS
jgi:CDP-glucose 4,6-dehydratase